MARCLPLRQATTTYRTTRSFNASSPSSFPGEHHHYSTKRNKNQGSSSDDKHTLLEKPDRFRPPSHGARRVGAARNRANPINYPGPKQTEQEIQAAKTRDYPHMFPREGTIMYWFLTNRWIHIWISLVCRALLFVPSLPFWYSAS